jgi:hypothetical protein
VFCAWYHVGVRRLVLACALIATSCNKTQGDPEDLFGSAATKPNGSAGGFSAALAADLKGGSGSGSGSTANVKPPTPPPTPTPAGSAMTPTPTPPVGSGATPAPPPTTAGVSVLPAPRTPGLVPPTPTPADPAMPATAPKAHVPAKVSPELAAIQLKIPAKWMRDVDEAGTFTRDLDAVSQEVTFVFHYGYDEPGAPKDRLAYLKFLADKKILLPANPDKETLNRQRGGALYIEGLDANGKSAFRYSVLYGDKHLICGGPLYRELGLGDFRDAVIIEAKSICESISM